MRPAKERSRRASGVPLRLAIGPRDLENDNAELARRDTQEKQVVSQDGLVERVDNLLDEIQESLYDRALQHREDNTRVADDSDEFRRMIGAEGGFVWAHWDGSAETEQRIQEETSATIRLIPFDREERESGEDMLTGERSEGRVLFAKAY